MDNREVPKILPCTVWLWFVSGDGSHDTFGPELRPEQAQQDVEMSEVVTMGTTYLVNLVAAVEGKLDDEIRAMILDHVADVADELVSIEESDPKLSNSDMSVNLHEREVRLSVCVDAASLGEAARIGVTALRAAIHAAGGVTPRWGAHSWSVGFGDNALGNLVGV